MAHPKTADRVDAVQATICMDYFFLTDLEEGKQQKKATGDKTAIPTAVVATDTSTGAVGATMVVGKGAELGFSVIDI